MTSRTAKILWVVALLLIGLGFVVAGQPSLRDKARSSLPQATPTPLPLPSGVFEEIYEVDYTARELALFKEGFVGGKEVWRSDAVEVVRHELARLGIPAGVGVREHGEYHYTSEKRRQTLILATQAFRDINVQIAVLVEEDPLGFWIPKAVGPFYKMVDRIGR